MSRNWRALYPFEGKFFDRGGGIRMRYLDEGRGEPVVMVHGNPSWSFYYRDLAIELRKTHRVLAPDHVGMGFSDRPGEDRYQYTLRSRVEDFGRWLDSLKLEAPVTLVVHDWGGMIGLAWAVQNPDKVKRLVVFNTAGFLPPAGKSLPWQLKLARGPLGAFFIRGLNLFCLGAVRRCVTRRPMREDVAQGYLAPYDSWDARLAVLRFVEDIPLSPADPAYAICASTGQGLARLAEKPALICWGARDFVFDDAFLDEFRRRLPRAELRRFADCGHYVLEDGGEEIVPLVAAFTRAPVEAR